MEGYTRDDLGYCVPASAGGDDSDTQSGTVNDTAADTGSPVAWITLPASCEAPTTLGTDPITQLDELLPGEGGLLYEMVDIELLDGVAYVVGQGGLLLVDATPGAAAVIGGGVSDRFHRVEPLSPGFVALTHRDRGIELVDVSDPADLVRVSTISARGWEGLAYVDGYLFVSARDEGVVVLDVSEPQAPSRVAEAAGLQAPWELSKARDGWIYAADNTLGVVPIDIADPLAPVVGEPVDVGGPVLHVAVAGDHVYAAAGGTGVVVLDLSDPAAPLPVATLPTGGSVVAVAVADGLLYAADHTGLAVWDVSDPGSPLPLGREETPQFALGVAASDDVAWVTDWTALESWAVDRDARSPEGSLSSTEVLLPDTGGSDEITLANLGGAELSLLGATSSDPRLAVAVSAEGLAPGDIARVQLTFTADGAPLDATVCIATDDADGALKSIRVSTAGYDPYVGQPAPDFALPGSDGNTYRLSEQLGHPVMLVYFATW